MYIDVINLIMTPKYGLSDSDQPLCRIWPQSAPWKYINSSWETRYENKLVGLGNESATPNHPHYIWPNFSLLRL